MLVIGDRAIRPLELGQVATYDLGEEWLKETGLPFVFAMWVARRLDEEQGKTVSALKIKGLYPLKEAKRRYPNGEMAAHVVGFVGLDGEGLADGRPRSS